LSLDEHKINSSMYNSIAVLKTIKAILYEKWDSGDFKLFAKLNMECIWSSMVNDVLQLMCSVICQTCNLTQLITAFNHCF
jgi:hypothetical protein